MSRALAYCAFRYHQEISLPQTGVRSNPVRVVTAGQLQLLWSEVEWPLAPERMQRSALEFHEVIFYVFKQAAVIPFRLLSVFEDERALVTFLAEHAEAFVKDLERLQNYVQMECVVFPAPKRAPTDSSSGTAYLREKAEQLRAQEEHIQVVRESLSKLGREIRVREGKNGTRLFVLLERGRESEFRSAVQQLAVPGSLSRRMSGPWPAAEFLSEQVRTPQVASVKTGAH